MKLRGCEVGKMSLAVFSTSQIVSSDNHSGVNEDSFIRAKARLVLSLSPQPEGWGYDRLFVSVQRLVSV